MNIGSFKSVNGQLLGSVNTANLSLPRLGLRPVKSNNTRAPAYEVVSLNPGKQWVQVGAIWEAVSKGSGEIFYQGQLDDPSMTQALPIALFGNDDDGYRVAWTRKTARRDSFDDTTTGTRSAPNPSDDFEGNATEAGELATTEDDAPAF